MIPVYDQIFTDHDAEAARQIVSSGFLSGTGSKVVELEEVFAKYTNRKYAASCSNGTAALYLAFKGFDLPSGATVAIPACSYAATGFATDLAGHKIECIDAEDNTWNMDLSKLEDKLKEKQIDVVIVVHNYGSPVDFVKLNELKKKYKFLIIEDACEAMHARHKGNIAGSLGDISVFSFYGNKLCSSGEGGIVVTDNKKYHDLICLHKGQGQDPKRKFWHIVKGFNFRMTNVQAAVVLSQFDRIDSTQKRKLEIKDLYTECLPKFVELQGTLKGCEHSWWMVSIKSEIPNFYKKASKHLMGYNVETRPIFPPLPSMPAFEECKDQDYTIAKWLNKQAITLPSGPATKNEDIIRICRMLKEIK